MKEGDIFNPKHIYFAYYNQLSSDSPMIRMYIFTVSRDIKYEVHNYFNMHIIRYILLQHGVDSITVFISSIYKRNIPIPYHITSEAVWKLTEDETMDVLSEVI
jgi:hypothetical protein